MPSLDSLPGDQRAVLELVLGRGRSYDEIARLLSIDRAAVRGRALAAADALASTTDLDAAQRQHLTDYLLGQLPAAEVDDIRDLLGRSPHARAWARVLSAELTQLATGPMPPIPDEVERAASAPAAGQAPGAAPAADQAPAAGQAPAPAPAAGHAEASAPAAATARRSSRRGGIVVIAAGLAVVVAAVLFLVLRSGSSKHHPVAAAPTTASAPATASTPGAAAAAGGATATAPASASSTTSARVVAQINLFPPGGKSHSKAVGIAEILREGATDGVAIVAQNVPPNTTRPPDAYAVWLYNSSQDAHRLGFVNPGVGRTRRFSTATQLPTGAGHYRRLIVTLETTGRPRIPGRIILQGTLTGV